jgi:tetratricopeptide (TPR) repeat protein
MTHWHGCLLLLVPLGLAAHPCESCHPNEVAGYARSPMSNSLRRAAREPEGAFTAAASATHFTIHSSSNGSLQRMERNGQASEYPVAFVIGSGRHASGFLVQIGDHLFQSPICFYTTRKAYDLAPGYERIPEPDFTRPVGEECVLCHSGRPLNVPGAVNRYSPPVFAEEAISCDRCHGRLEEHLRRPAPGSIINPAKLAPAARDSVCEQCHLTGVARILNPDKAFHDFRAGQRLEEVFTVYTRSPNHDFRVISHAEQLALSACARNSGGKLWCGTCHDPHPEANPTAKTYNARCQTCHSALASKSHPSGNDCVSCHMTRRQARDGGHTVFTDHRITRRPEPEEPVAPAEDLVAWRAPDPALQSRNLALAYVSAGISDRSPAEMVRGYRMLTEAQKSAPDDVAVLRAIGRALLLGKQPAEALRAFERALELTGANAGSEEDVGVAYLESGQPEKAISHLEKALTVDPFLLTAATELEEAYRRAGQPEKADDLARRMRLAMGGASAAPRR